jgi:hypothetical protein
MRRELYRNALAAQALNVASISSNTNTDGTAIGVAQAGQNFRSVMFVATCTARTDGSYALVPIESATSGGSYTAVPAERLLGPSAALAAVNTCQSVGMIVDPTMPFVKLRVTSTGVTSGAAVTAVALLGSGSNYPVQ